MRKILDFVAVAYWDPYYVGRPGTGIATAICHVPHVRCASPDGGGQVTKRQGGCGPRPIGAGAVASGTTATTAKPLIATATAIAAVAANTAAIVTAIVATTILVVAARASILRMLPAIAVKLPTPKVERIDRRGRETTMATAAVAVINVGIRRWRTVN